MTEENEQDMFVAKFMATDRKRRERLLKYFFEESNCKDTIIDFLNHKQLRLADKNITEGDLIDVPIDYSMYSKLSREYYEKHDKISENDTVKVKVARINPVSSYVYIQYFSDLTIESTYKVYNSNLPKQEDLFELF